MKYGKGYYGRGPYAYTQLANTNNNIPITVFVYTRLGVLKNVIQTGSQKILDLTFKHNQKGCADFTIDFGYFVDIAKSDIIKIFIFNNQKSFFCGVVRSVPIQGSTSQTFAYTGYGLNDYFVRMNAENHVYAAKTLDYIVGDILNTEILLKSPIQYSADRISLPLITVTSFTINYSQISDVLDAIKKIADSTGTLYFYGVDSDGYFFFRPQSQDIQATLVVGKQGANGIQAYEPKDEEETKTRLFVLRNDGTLLTTILSAYPNDISEDKVKGPLLSDADLLLWAQGYLNSKSVANRSATVEWLIEKDTQTIDAIFSNGIVRIISNIPSQTLVAISIDNFGDGNMGDGLFGGSPYQGYDLIDTLQIVEISYSFAKGGTRSLTLGALPLRIEEAIAAINKETTDLAISLGV